MAAHYACLCAVFRNDWNTEMNERYTHRECEYVVSELVSLRVNYEKYLCLSIDDETSTAVYIYIYIYIIYIYIYIYT